MELLDVMAPLERPDNAPLRIPVLARYKDRGVICILGKVESGTLVVGEDLIMMPTGKLVTCSGILVDEKEVDIARAGENCVIQIKGVEKEEEVSAGFVLSYPSHPTKKTKMLNAQFAILDLLPHKPLVTAGYLCIFHCHTVVVECQIAKLLADIDAKGKPSKSKPRYVKSGGTVIARIILEDTIAVETFDDFQQLGRFTLRDEGSTIAVGKILSIVERTKEADRAERNEKILESSAKAE